jgi:hypothetical protein
MSTEKRFLYYVGSTKIFPEMIEELRDSGLDIDDELEDKIEKTSRDPFDCIALVCSLNFETGEITIERVARYDDYLALQPDP